MSRGVPDAFIEGDGALLELYTLHASRGEWALGPYSRFGWYHPGPFYLYLLVPFYVASGHHALALTAGAVAINVMAFTIIVWTLSRHAAGAMTVAVVGALAVYLLRVPEIVSSAWNPHVLLLPYAALIVSSAAVASGGLQLLPLVALLATFITQTHVGLAPEAVAITACALTAALRARQPQLWKWLRVSALTLFVAWLPPLYDQLAGTGNLGRLLMFFAEGSATPSSRQTFAVWVGTLLQPLMPDFTSAWGGAMPPMPKSPLLGTSAIVEVLLLFVAATWLTKRGGAIEAWLCRLSAIASVIAIIAIARVRGGLVDHLTFWNTITGVMNAAALAGAALLTVSEIARKGRAARWMSALVPLTCAIAMAGVAYKGATVLSERRADQLKQPTPEASPVGRLYHSTRTTIARARLRRPLIEVKGTWADAAGILVQLHKHDIPVGVEHGVAWLYGAPIGERGDEDGTVTIADAPTAKKLAQEQDACLIVSARDTFIFVRVPTLDQYLKLRCIPLP